MKPEIPDAPWWRRLKHWWDYRHWDRDVKELKAFAEQLQEEMRRDEFDAKISGGRVSHSRQSASEN